MAQTLTINVHAVRGASTNSVEAALPRIRQLYADGGIDINFAIQSEALRDDPADSRDIVRRLPATLGISAVPSRPPTAHLVIGRAPWPLDHEGYRENGTPGVLVDLETRAIAAVFTSSFTTTPAQRVAAEIAQTAAHEIGHILDLVHDTGGDAGAGTIMQAPDRPVARPKILRDAWASPDIASSGAPGELPRYPTAIATQQLSEHLFPLSRPARNHLLHDPNVLPFSTPFRGRHAGDLLRRLGTVQLEASLDLPRDRVRVGDPLLLRLELSNRSRRPVRLPRFLEPSLGNLSIDLEVAGWRRRVAARSAACGTATFFLPPGQSSTFELVRLSDRLGPLLSLPGKVSVTVTSRHPVFVARGVLIVEPGPIRPARLLANALASYRLKSVRALALRLLKSEDLSVLLRSSAGVIVARVARNAKFAREAASHLAHLRSPEVFANVASLECIIPYQGRYCTDHRLLGSIARKLTRGGACDQAMASFDGIHRGGAQ